MSRILLSQSWADSTQAIALRDWLADNGWNDVFLDVDLQRGSAPDARWESALPEAGHRCEAAVFLISKAWISSPACRSQFHTAEHLNKMLLAVLIEDLRMCELPQEISEMSQIVRLVPAGDYFIVRATDPITKEEVSATFSAEGLRHLKFALELAGLEPKRFAWPPLWDSSRPPYRGGA